MKIVRILITSFLLITAFVLQGTVFSWFSIADIAPNLCLIMAVSYGLLRGKKQGLLIGFFAGLLMDIFSSNLLGINAVIIMYLGYMAGNFHKMFFMEDVKLSLAMITIADFFYGIATYAFMFLLRGRMNFAYYLSNIIVPEIIYTIIMTIAIYPLLYKLNHYFDVKEERRS